MPAQYVYDDDKEFFKICRRTLPYFIHAKDDEFRNKLISIMEAVDWAHHDMHKTNLPELIQRANNLLDEYDETHRSVMHDNITNHLFRVTTFEERINAVERLVRGKRSKKDDKDISELKEKV